MPQAEKYTVMARFYDVTQVWLILEGGQFLSFREPSPDRMLPKPMRNIPYFSGLILIFCCSEKPDESSI